MSHNVSFTFPFRSWSLIASMTSLLVLSDLEISWKFLPTSSSSEYPSIFSNTEFTYYNERQYTLTFQGVSPFPRLVKSGRKRLEILCGGGAWHRLTWISWFSFVISTASVECSTATNAACAEMSRSWARTSPCSIQWSSLRQALTFTFSTNCCNGKHVTHKYHI